MKRILMMVSVLALCLGSVLTAQVQEASIDGTVYTFEVKAKGSQDEFVVNALVIHKKNDKAIYQTLSGFEASPPGELKDVQGALIIEDVDFDGFPDLRMAEFMPAGPDVPYLFWLYNKKTKKFEQTSIFGDLASPIFDQESKRITSWWRDNAAHYGKNTYAMVDGKLLEIIHEDVLYNDTTGLYEYTRSGLVDKKMKVIEKKKSKTDPLE